jgi:DNA-binding transcriptional LysR family regulator
MRELNKLNTFVRVAEHLSFTKAARDLRMTPSAVSKHVHEFETKLGFALLNRSTHGVVLTEVGESFARRCASVLGNLDSAVIDARNRQKTLHGTLRIHRGYRLCPLGARAVLAGPHLSAGRRAPPFGLRRAGLHRCLSALTFDKPGARRSR